MAAPTSAAEMELINNISSAEARANFEKWWNEERVGEINEKWRIRRKFLSAKGDDPSLKSRYVLIDVQENPGDHKKLGEILPAQIAKKEEAGGGEEGGAEGADGTNELWVSVKGCNYVTTVEVCKHLPQYQQITKVCLGEGVDVDDSKLVAEMVKSMPSLTALDLSGNQEMGSEGCKVLIEGLAEVTSLTDLDLSNCAIGKAAAKSISNYLETNPPLERLLLNGNKLGIYGAEELMPGVRVNTTLSTLGLFLNNMGEDGVEHVLSIFTTDLPPDEGGGEAEAATQTEGVAKQPPAFNWTLLEVEIGDNKASEAQTKRLEEALARNKELAQKREIERKKKLELERIEQLAREKEEERRRAEEEEQKKAEEERAKAEEEKAKQEQAAAKPAAKGAPKPGSKAAAKPAGKAGVTKGAAKPAAKPAASSSPCASKPAAKPAAKPVGKPAARAKSRERK